MIPQMTFEPSIAIAAGRVEKFGLNIKSFREPLQRAVKKVVAPSIKKNFDVGGRPPWPDLEEMTVMLRARKGYGATPILVQSGMLKRTASQQSIWTFTQTSAAVLSLPPKIWYGALHQSGWTTKGYVAPPRPWLMIQDEDQGEIREVFEDWLIERWEKAYPGR